jgi:hypothetical protein
MWRVGCDPILQRYGETYHSPTLELHLQVESQIRSQYLDTTGFKGDIYADSSRETFQTLELKVTLQTTPKGEKKKSYLPGSMFVNVMASMWVSTADSQVL